MGVGVSAELHGSVRPRAMRLDTDVAQLLFTSALTSDAMTAVGSALDVAGPTVLGAALPLLVKPALTAPQRRALREHKGLVDNLTHEITERTGHTREKPIELRRVKPLNIVMFVAFAFALWVILAQVGSLGESVAHDDRIRAWAGRVERFGMTPTSGGVVASVCRP
jgi:hypothetical protein